MPRHTPSWLENAVFYQVYPQSFQDSNGDGIGDIKGLISRLPYIKSLGCDALWINPWFESPFQDAGYDVSDYYKVAPRYGTNADAARLFKEARRLGLRVCLDLVPAHTSVRHEWFRQSAQARPNKYTDWFVWASPVWAHSPWTGEGFADLDLVRGWGERDASYIPSFFYSQPALNWGFAKPDPRKPWQQKPSAPGPKAVAQAMLQVMRFWLRMGADGFRVDMAGHLVKQDPGQKATIRVWQRLMPRLKREFPEAAMISEWGVPRLALKAGFDVDFMLHFPTPGYNSLLRDKDCYFRAKSPKSAGLFFREFRHNLRQVRKGGGFISVPTGNHDMDRLSLGRDEAGLKACFALLLTLPSIPFIYYGDELGMKKVEGLVSKEGGYNRTGSRTPMQWAPGRNLGFSKAAPAKLYLPVDRSRSAPTAAAQERDPGSPLRTLRRLIALRRRNPALGPSAGFRLLHDGSGGRPLAFLRWRGGQKVLVAVHPKAKPGSLALKSLSPKFLSESLCRGMRLERGPGGGLRLEAAAQGFGIFVF